MRFLFADKFMTIFSLAVLFVALSCKSNDTLIAPTLMTPLATGIWFTTDTGPDIIGKLGNPADSYDSRVGPPQRVNNNGNIYYMYFTFLHPYPNPFSGSVQSGYQLLYNSTVDLWIVKARYINDHASDETNEGGATTISPTRTTIKTIFHNEPKTVGVHAFVWDGTDDGGNLVQGGFYRIYLRTNGWTSFHDVLIVRQLSDIPPSWRKILVP